jgi:hypothetical protein
LDFSQSVLKEYSDPKLGKDYLDFKNIIMEKQNCAINSKTVMKNISHVKLSCESLNFMVLAYPGKNPFT